jgi:hypothetical protein
VAATPPGRGGRDIGCFDREEGRNGRASDDEDGLVALGGDH